MFYRVWIVVVFFIVAHELGFVAAGCAALGAIAGYMAKVPA
jgi:hypothetical protein